MKDMTNSDPNLRPEPLIDDVDRALRPQNLNDFTGQSEARANLKVFIESAKKRGQAMDHTLFYDVHQVEGVRRNREQVAGAGFADDANLPDGDIPGHVRDADPAVERPKNVDVLDGHVLDPFRSDLGVDAWRLVLGCLLCGWQVGFVRCVADPVSHGHALHARHVVLLHVKAKHTGRHAGDVANV